VVERVAANARRVVFLSAPHRTPHPFFRQPNPMAALFAGIEQRIVQTGLDRTIIRPGMFSSNVAIIGRARSATTVSSDGRTERPRPRRWMTAMWRLPVRRHALRSSCG
jgi:uncharacterized protein YbjT (DUF2867 family)